LAGLLDGDAVEEDEELVEALDGAGIFTDAELRGSGGVLGQGSTELAGVEAFLAPVPVVYY
jgi:hypothetical protein